MDIIIMTECPDGKGYCAALFRRPESTPERKVSFPGMMNFYEKTVGENEDVLTVQAQNLQNLLVLGFLPNASTITNVFKNEKWDIAWVFMPGFIQKKKELAEKLKVKFPLELLPMMDFLLEMELLGDVVYVTQDMIPGSFGVALKVMEEIGPPNDGKLYLPKDKILALNKAFQSLQEDLLKRSLGE
jgi:hypothetical protein